MSRMDPVAASGFGAAAGHYARSRPAYARPSIGLVKEAMPAGRVLDLAAGTGILTGQLSRSGLDVIAVEPLAEMLTQLRRALPGVPAMRAAAESLPVGANALAGVTAAQAFHWFDAPAALAEAARVLRPDGVLALLWNERDESVPWVRDLTDLVHHRSGGRPYSDHRDHAWEDVVARTRLFGEARTTSFDNPVPSSPVGVAERVRSTSFVAVMPELEREALLAEVKQLVATTPELAGRDRFDYPHRTRVYLWTARG